MRAIRLSLNTNCHKFPHMIHKKFFILLCLLLSQLSASQWPRHCMVLDRCYMHFVLRHTRGAGHHEIYQLPHYFTTYHLLSSKPANNALQQANLKTLLSGGFAWGWLVEAKAWFWRRRHSVKRLIGRLIRQWRSKARCYRWAGPCLFAVTVVTY